MKAYHKMRLECLKVECEQAIVGLNYLLEHVNEIEGDFGPNSFTFKDAAALGNCLLTKKKFEEKGVKFYAE